MKNIYSEIRLRSGCLHEQILSYSFSFFPRFRTICERDELNQILTNIYENFTLTCVIILGESAPVWYDMPRFYQKELSFSSFGAKPNELNEP